VDQPDLVGGMQGFGDLFDDAHRAGRFQRPVGEHGLQVAALDQSHTHEQSTVDLPIVMDRDHVRGAQSCGRVGFAAEPLLKVLVVREVSGQDFDRDDPVGVGVMRPPDLTHAAAAQQLDEAVTPERRALHRLTIRSQPHRPRANRDFPLPVSILADSRHASELAAAKQASAQTDSANPANPVIF
jgi:hypothetical protein